MGQQEQPIDRDPVAAVLVFLDLLVGEAERRRELLLDQAELVPPGPDALADLLLDASCPASPSSTSVQPPRWRTRRGLAMLPPTIDGSTLLIGSSCGKTARIGRADDSPSKVMPMASRLLPPACVPAAAARFAARWRWPPARRLRRGTATEEAAVEKPPEELYSDAQALLEEGDFEAAARAFEEVERQHPYSQWATRGQLMAAYAFYEANQYDEAVAAAERFIDLHPGNRDVPYAYYMVGMSLLRADLGCRARPGDDPKSLDAFNELIRRFPDSDYATDAKLKVDLVQDHLAGKEMEVGRYYQRRQLWLAGINRFQKVVEQYQTTTHVPEALHRLTESYLALGMTQQAQESAAVLGYNFPGSEWYERSYALLQGENLEPRQAEGGSWLSRLF